MAAACTPTGKQKQRPRKKVSVPNYRSSGYRPHGRDKFGNKKLSYARQVNNGRRELLTPEQLGQRLDQRSQYVSVGPAMGILPVK